MNKKEQTKTSNPSRQKVDSVRRRILIGAGAAPLLLTLRAKSLTAAGLDDHIQQSAVGAPFSNVLQASGGTTSLENELYLRLPTDSKARAYYGTPGSEYVITLISPTVVTCEWHFGPSGEQSSFAQEYEATKIGEKGWENAIVEQVSSGAGIGITITASTEGTPTYHMELGEGITSGLLVTETDVFAFRAILDAIAVVQDP